MSREELAALLKERPTSDRGHNSLCFLGSFDYVEGVFYLANVFAGNGRYASRYLLHQGSRRYRPSPAEDEWLDVQLVVPFKGNRSYIAAEFRAGCGFEARYRHYFEQWIDPYSILIEARNGEVVYRDGRSGRLLRFHFFGFVLAEHLSADYQLLLADHADAYLNPFEGRTVTPPGQFR